MPPASLLVNDLPPRRPSVAFMLSHPAHLLALGFGAGLAPLAPGTCGTLWAWLAFAVLQHWLAPGPLAAVVALSLPLGWWACTTCARNLRVADPGAIVWDEIVAFWLVLVFVMPAGFKTQLWAFIWFRAIDMLKPTPIRQVEKRLKGGFGVMADDILAAFYTLLLFAIWENL